LLIVVGGFGGLGNDAIGCTDGASDAIGTAGSGAIGTGIDGFGIGFGALPRSRSRFWSPGPEQATRVHQT
jgi:hypothetical protein